MQNPNYQWQGSDLAAGKLGGADTLSPYHPPGPPTGTGYHRYGQVRRTLCFRPMHDARDTSG